MSNLTALTVPTTHLSVTKAAAATLPCAMRCSSMMRSWGLEENENHMLYDYV